MKDMHQNCEIWFSTKTRFRFSLCNSFTFCWLCLEIKEVCFRIQLVIHSKWSESRESKKSAFRIWSCHKIFIIWADSSTDTLVRISLFTEQTWIKNLLKVCWLHCFVIEFAMNFVYFFYKNVMIVSMLSVFRQKFDLFLEQYVLLSAK